MEENKLITVEQVSQMLDVVPRRIYYYMANHEDPIPVAIRGKHSRRTLFDPGEVHQWALRRHLRGLGEEGVSLKHEKALLTKAQRLKAEIDLRERAKSLIEASIVAKFIDDEYSRVRSRLLGLPASLAGLLEGMEIEQRRDAIESSIRDALIELSDASPFEAGDSDEGPMDAAAETDTESMGGPVSDAELGGECGAGPVED